MSSYFYCRIRTEELLCDAERNLSAIAKFFVVNSLKSGSSYLGYFLLQTLGGYAYVQQAYCYVPVVG